MEDNKSDNNELPIRCLDDDCDGVVKILNPVVINEKLYKPVWECDLCGIHCGLQINDF